jgi:hypothetical protein
MSSRKSLTQTVLSMMLLFVLVLTHAPQPHPPPPRFPIQEPLDNPVVMSRWLFGVRALR